MAFPASDLPDPSTWFSNALITSALMKSNITDAINVLPRGFIGSSNSTGTVTLNAIADFGGLATLTFVLNSQRRVRIAVVAGFAPAGATTARYRVRAGYNTGGSQTIGSFVQVGQPSDQPNTTANPCSGQTEGDVLLAAGTYTAYAIVRRSNGGAATDTATNFYTIVEDLGAS